MRRRRPTDRLARADSDVLDDLADELLFSNVFRRR
jgi:hypothetical protein